MTTYPSQIDDDRTLIRIDDNLSELGTEAINQLREAVFAIEKTLGINPQGSKTSVNDRISVLIGPNGNVNAAALAAVGLVTLPIHDNQVSSAAGIQESKLDLAYSTSDLATNISDLDNLVSNVISDVNEINANLIIHIFGSTYLTDNSTLARHVASQIDINTNPTDSRDLSYSWTGLLDVNGNLRTAGNVAEALLQINNELVSHQNSTFGAHSADSITLDTTNFTELPITITNVQEALDYIDDQETVSTGLDRAILHTNGIVRDVRVEDPRIGVDGYNVNIIPTTKVTAYLSYSQSLCSAPVDNINNGDDVIKFFPTDNSTFEFDALFSRVNVGDSIRINYGFGIEAIYPVKSIRFIPGIEWAVRINTDNLINLDGYDGYEGYDGYARIDRALFDRDTWGVMAVAGAVPNTSPISDPFPESIIVASPKGAAALGLGFDPAKLDQNHYNLYLRLYPSGEPSVYTDLPAIDVTGNVGATPGAYTIDSVVEATNLEFRKSGYNYRLIAFNHKGEFGLILADCYNNVAFSIISGQVSGTTIIESTYVQNVVGDATDGYDALGLGATRTGFATPVLGVGNNYINAQTALSYSTLVIPSVTGRNSLVDGVRRDDLGTSGMTYPDGYWLATVSDVNLNVPSLTKTIAYTIDLDLKSQEIKPGKTIVVQPVSSSNSNISGYGRFIIGKVEFSGCDTSSQQTIITVINAIHGTGDSLGATLPINTQVKLFFSEDSVGFNDVNIVGGNFSEYHRYHEIFASNVRDTFAIERARMPKHSTVSSPGRLDTTLDNWRVRRVSPKLRGARVNDEIRYYKSFVVSNYNTTTGEFDGYLGNPNGFGNIINVGPTVRGKKNHPVRFYDSNYVDFIDVEFREFQASGDTTIPDGYVNIEIFDSLKEHDQFFPLAGVSHNNFAFKSITDLREFGTLSEENFTDSAINFIQAGERIIHANGVVRGFNYIDVTSTSNAVLQFTGGIALVNGAFISLDSFDVKLPEIKTSSSDIVEFFICVTQGGQLQAVVKDIGEQFFEVDDNYFVESLNFSEIVDKRKDLCVVAKVTAQIADQDGGIVTYQLQSVLDARRFIFNQDINEWTVALQEDGYFTTFRSADAMKCWAVEYGIKEFLFVHENIDSEIDLTGITSDVTIKAKNPITVTSEVGFRAGSNVHFCDIDFIYNALFPALPIGFPGFDYIDTANLSLVAACVIFDNNSADMSNISVKKCSFTRTVLGQRPPFVMAIIDDDNYLSNVDISKNIFIPNLPGVNSEDSANCAVAILCTATVFPGYAKNVNIEKNQIEGANSILVTSLDLGVGLYSQGVYIDKNIIPDGMIGYGTIGDDSGASGSVRTSNCLEITSNNASAICWADSRGVNSSLGNDFDNLGTGNVLIGKNKATSIVAYASGNVSYIKSTLSILNNTLINTHGLAYLYKWGVGGIVAGNPFPTIIGIFCSGPTSSTYSSTYIRVDENIVSSTQANIYDYGIQSNTQGSIRGNFINTFDNIGILSLASDSRTIISENTINRNGRVIDSYISCNNDTVIDNIFDDSVIDNASDEETINIAGANNIIERNVNHINTVQVSLWGSFQGTETNSFVSSTQEGIDGTSLEKVRVATGVTSGHSLTLQFGSTGNAAGLVSLLGVLPPGAKFVSATISVAFGNPANWSTGTFTLTLLSEESSLDTDSTTYSSSAITTVSDSGYTRNDALSLRLRFSDMNPVGASANVGIDDLFVTYIF